MKKFVFSLADIVLVPLIIVCLVITLAFAIIGVALIVVLLPIIGVADILTLGQFELIKHAIDEAR